MIQRKFMRTRQLKPGMKLDHPVVDRMGHILIARGGEVDQYIIDALIRLGVMTVYIQIGEEDPEEDEKKVSPLALENIEKFRTEDRAQVKLSSSVKKRVAEGIQYIYSNAESSDMINATNSITDDLLDAIESNNSIALNISELKTNDEYTFKHSVDVATIGMVIAKQENLSKKQVREIGIAGLLHDLGKSKIPPEILNKPGRLTKEEFDIMKQHPVFSYRLLEGRTEFSPEIHLGVLQHHEKANGSGYPMSVSGEKICPYAKIITVADIYDALVTKRPYKNAFSQRDAIEMIMSMTMELDLTAMDSFLHSMILYPVDSIVELSNGEKAKVVKNSADYILRPVVVGLETGNVYDLGKDINCANLVIL